MITVLHNGSTMLHSDISVYNFKIQPLWNSFLTLCSTVFISFEKCLECEKNNRIFYQHFIADIKQRILTSGFEKQLYVIELKHAQMS